MKLMEEMNEHGKFTWNLKFPQYIKKPYNWALV